MARWQALNTQSDSIAEYEDQLVLVGLGKVEFAGEEYASKYAIWQWMKLPFGQSALAKRRLKPSKTTSDQLSKDRKKPMSRDQQVHLTTQTELPFAKYLEYERQLRRERERQRERKSSSRPINGPIKR